MYTLLHYLPFKRKPAASVTQSNARLTGDQEDAGSISPGPENSFVETDNEILSTVILSLPRIQEGQLSVFDETMCTSSC